MNSRDDYNQRLKNLSDFHNDKMDVLLLMLEDELINKADIAYQWDVSREAVSQRYQRIHKEWQLAHDEKGDRWVKKGENLDA